MMPNVLRILVGAALALVLGGCAPTSYVVLLDDGVPGKLTLTGPHGTTVLEQNRQGAALGCAAGKTFTVSEAQLQRDFGAALAASPRRPVSFLLYFETAGARLTAQSEAEIPNVLAEVAHRPAADVSVIGHTDTVGAAAVNLELGLSRARFVAGRIAEAGVAPERVAVESHGEKNLLVATPDETDEPRNRCVEITVR